MNRYISFILTIFFFPAIAWSQEVKFRSSEFEIGVRMHLGIDDTGTITVQHTDTITTLDLSGLAITDIRDVEYFPNLKKLNLDFNEVSDVAPLVNLDNLSHVSLRYNRLESIHILSFSNSSEMTIDLSFNKIEDFSCFKALTPCRFTVEGAWLQLGESEEYKPILGDANGDGKVDATDIVDIVNYMIGKPTSTGKFKKEAADVNGDDTVNVADNVAIVNIITGN